jgi:DNA-directed RNA polymerase specialized sigma24 family protein
VGLYHRKFNGGKELPPRGYRIAFEGQRTRIERIDIDTVEELSANLPLHDRITTLILRDGPLSIKQLAEELGVTQNAVRARLSRHSSLFQRVGSKWGSKKTSSQATDF